LPEPAGKAVSSSQAATAAALLPPGANADEPLAAPREQVAIPRAPQRLPQIPQNVASGAVVVPTADGGYVAVRESPKVIGSGDDELEVRRLAPEEKARRRLRRNLMLWTFCLLVLIAVFYFFTR
jgi:hypothetical protein